MNSGHDDEEQVGGGEGLHQQQQGQAKVHPEINRNILTISEIQTLEEAANMSREYKKVIVRSLRCHSAEL